MVLFPTKLTRRKEGPRPRPLETLDRLPLSERGDPLIVRWLAPDNTDITPHLLARNFLKAHILFQPFDLYLLQQQTRLY